MALLGAATLPWTPGTHAQSLRKIARIGVLWHAANAEEEDVYLSVLRKAFNDLGYVGEQNVHLEHRFPGEKPDRFRIMARGSASTLSIESGLLAETVPSTFAKVLNMQREGSNRLDIAGSGRPAGLALRPPCDAACGAW